jgi:hypothetical protein
MKTKKTTSKSSDANQTRLASSDGALQFKLSRQTQGVFVERSYKSEEGCFVRLASVFLTDADFSAWCAMDDLRFQYPHLYAELQREFHVLNSQT